MNFNCRLNVDERFMLYNFCVRIAFFNLRWRGFDQKEERKNVVNNLKARSNTTNI